MARQWMKLVRISPLILGIICSVPQMVIIVPTGMAQDIQRSQETEAHSLLMEGIILREQETGDASLRQALEKLQQALVLFRAMGGSSEERLQQLSAEITTLNVIASTYLRLEEFQLALDYYQQVLPLYRETGDRKGEADNLDSIGRVYDSLGQTPQALDYLQQALSIWREVGDRQGEVITLDFMGAVYNRIGKHQQALDFYQQALLIRRELGNSIDDRLRQRSAEANTLNTIGEIYRATGQYQQALDFYQQALLINKELDNSLEEKLPQRSREATILNNIGIVYRIIGQLPQALNFYQQALSMMKIAGNRDGEAAVLNNIGLVYDELKQPDQALGYYQQALPIAREIDNRNGEATALNNIGAIYERLRQPQQALAYYQQALEINQAIGDRTGEAGNLNNIGIVYDGLGQLLKAVDYYQRSLLISQQVGDRDGEANTLYNLASAQKNLNNLPEALQSIQAAIAIVEDIRGQLISPEFRTSYFATVQNYYKIQIDLLMQLHTSTPLSNLQQNPNQSYAAQAFNITERSKARTLLELLTESQANIRTGVDPQLLQQEQELQSQLASLDKRRIELANTKDDNSLQIADLEAQRTTLQTQYRNLQTQIRTTSPQYAALKYPQPLTLEQIQQQILDDNTIILSYSLGKDRSYLWLVSKTDMTSYQLPAQKIIEDLINQKVRPQLTNPRTSQTSFLDSTSELSNILLKPILEKIGNQRLVVISDGALQYLPFGALPDPRVGNNQYQPLLVNHEIVYLPSASTLQTIRNETQNRPSAPRTLAVLADPVFSVDDQRVSQGSGIAANSNQLPLAAQNFDRTARNARGDWNRLPGTRRESETILRLVPPSQSLALLDFQANRTNALSNQLAQYRFIHWATHGFANAQKPELSGIVMSLVREDGQKQDGYLLLGDIFNLNFNADLVVLSACETGLGEVVQGEGLIGLTRGLMYAGTPRVVTSLWAVPDEETATLMGSFYSKMLQQNKLPAEALRAAQLEMFRSRPWIAPYFWAAFTLQGEWQ